ncbi:MAG: hypothetical protein HQ472_05355 [Ignavibacteria bacterium]|nr:hypothetical protein [Ignavibacteria bacterium]
MHPVKLSTLTHLGRKYAQQYTSKNVGPTVAPNIPGVLHGSSSQSIALKVAAGSIGIGLTPTKQTLVIVVY